MPWEGVMGSVGNIRGGIDRDCSRTQNRQEDKQVKLCERRGTDAQRQSVVVQRRGAGFNSFKICNAKPAAGNYFVVFSCKGVIKSALCPFFQDYSQHLVVVLFYCKFLTTQITDFY